MTEVMATQIALFTGRQLMEKGTQKVLDRELEVWKRLAADWIHKLPIGTEFDAVELIEDVGAPPRHPNSVGALIRTQAKKGEIRWTGRFVQSSTASRHCGVIRIWERV
jgi:hypothetical protein